MIELTILELLYLVLIFFGIVIGTLLTLILLHALKVMRVVSEVTEYYYSLKNLVLQGLQIPNIIMEKFQESEEKVSEEKQKTTQ